MGDLNQLNYVSKNSTILLGPVLEIGSKDYGNTPNYRPLFKDSEYIGLDMEKGQNVDKVLNLTDDFSLIDKALNGKRFKTIICFSVLEHCLDVYRIAENIERLLDADGHLLISVPFSWEFHGFPSDYWRFTPDTIKFLFKKVSFIDSFTTMNTSNIDEIKVPDKEFFKIDLSPKVGFTKRRYSLITAFLVKVCKTLGLMPEILNNIYVLPPVEFNMIGRLSSFQESIVKT